MAYNLKDHREGAIKSTLKDLKVTIETLVGQVRYQHPKDQVFVLAEIHKALAVLQREYEIQCAEKEWKDPLKIPGVLARILSYLPVSDLRNTRLVNKDWCQESLAVLNRKCATTLIGEDEEEDIGFGRFSIDTFISIFDPESQKLPFDKFSLSSSVIPPYKQLMFDDMDLKESEELICLEQDLDGSVAELLRAFGRHIRELDLSSHEDMCAAGALGSIFLYTPNLRSLHLTFSVYPGEEIVAQNCLSNLKQLTVRNGIGNTKFLWSLLRAAVNLEELSFYSDSFFVVNGMTDGILLLDQFLRIPPPPVRRNILLHLKSLSLTGNEYPLELDVFPRLAKMELRLKEFKYESESANFSDPHVQWFLSSIGATLVHLEFHGDSIGDQVSSIVRLDIKTFIADFDVYSLAFVEKYDKLESLEIQGTRLQASKSSDERNCHRMLRSLRLKNFPPGREAVLDEIAKRFPNLAAFQVVCWGGYLQIIFERMLHLEELTLFQNARYMPDMTDDSDSGLDEDNNNNDIDDFFIGNAACNSLKSLGARNESISGKIWKECAWIGNLTKLRSLCLDKICALSSQAFIHGLTKCAGLKVLSLRDTKITDEVLVALADSLHPIRVNVTDCDSLTYSIPYFQGRHPFCYLEC